MLSQSAIETSGVCFGYSNGLALTDITFSIGAGEMVALIGPNGSGKTTLLKILLGILAPNSGAVQLCNKPLASYAPKERAKVIAYVSQQPALSFPLTVAELVALGRYPYAARNGLADADRSAVEAALDHTDSKHLGQRNFNTLSGGEKQKVLIARALAQSSRILLLDEPTLHLDVYYQLQILTALKKRCAEEGITVITVLHDVNLAALFADKALLLSAGAVRAFGPVLDVLNETSIRDLLDVQMKALEDPQTGARYFVPRDPLGSRRGRG
jgi:iron complex transport system ATP-binding protein